MLTRFKMAHYTLKYFLKSKENNLSMKDSKERPVIMKDNMKQKMYISQMIDMIFYLKI